MATITEQTIHTAANALTAEGVTPTLVKVRERIGGGSFTKISEAMKAWRALQNPMTTQPIELPKAIAEQAQAHALALWATSQGVANEQLALERLGFKEQLATMKGDKEEAEQFADDISEKIEISLLKVSSLEENDQALNKQLLELNVKLKVAEGRNEELIRENREALLPVVTGVKGRSNEQGIDNLSDTNKVQILGEGEYDGSIPLDIAFRLKFNLNRKDADKRVKTARSHYHFKGNELSADLLKMYEYIVKLSSN